MTGKTRRINRREDFSRDRKYLFGGHARYAKHRGHFIIATCCNGCTLATCSVPVHGACNLWWSDRWAEGWWWWGEMAILTTVHDGINIEGRGTNNWSRTWSRSLRNDVSTNETRSRSPVCGALWKCWFFSFILFLLLLFFYDIHFNYIMKIIIRL